MDEARRAKLAAAQKLHERAREIRGGFLNLVAGIERDLALILTDYFCTTDSGKREIFFGQVTRRMSLNQKREILVSIVQKDYPTFWDEHKDFIRDLQQIQEFRNKLAHSVVDASDSALARPLEEGVGFVQWRDAEPITDEELEDWEVRTNMLASTLIDIRRLLPYKEIPES